MKGFLRSSEGVFTLSPKITIVGRESCDFTIQNITVDSQHALIEYVEAEDCYVLKDLNSTHGSYVNECRIQNATVRLNEGDVLKFGFSAGQYEFHTDTAEYQLETEMDTGIGIGAAAAAMPIPLSMNPQPLQKPSWLPMTNSVSQGPSAQTTSFPLINYPQTQAFQHRHTINNGGLVSWSSYSKPPASLRSSRPLSASSLNRRQLTPTAPPSNQSNITFSRKGSISGPSKPLPADSKPHPNEDLRLIHFQAENDKIKALENELTEKSFLIGNLIQQNSELVEFLNSSKNNVVHNQIHNLKEEVENKKGGIGTLQNLIGNLTENLNRQNSNSSNNDSEINQIKQELEIIKRDLKTSNSLVTALQKDLNNREETINKLTRENQNLTHELSEKNVSISVLMNKLSRLKDIQEDETEKQDRERELISVKNRLSSSETIIQEQSEKIETLTNNLEKFQETDKVNSDTIHDLTKQLVDSKTVITDLERSESSIREDIQDIEKKFEQFRNRIVQVALSAPGVKSFDRSIKDEELIEIFKELVKNKVEHDRRLCEKERLLEEAVKKKKEIIENINSFKIKLGECYTILDSGERTSGRITDVVDLSKSITVMEELSPLKETIINNLENEKQFLSCIESCISDSGSELKDLSVSECFKTIVQRCIEAVEHRNQMEGRLNEAVESYEEKLERLKQAQKEEMDLYSQQMVEIERNESDKKYQSIIEELSSKEEQKRVDLIKSFESQIIIYEENVEMLKNRLEEKERETQDQIESLTTQIKDCDELMQRISDLEKELSEVTTQKITLEQSLCEQFDTINLKWKAEIDMYKEETAQHAITIDSLNDRLIKLNKENIDLKNQMLKSKTEKKKMKKTESVNVVSPEPDEKQKAKENEIALHYATVANLEKCISALRHENVLFKNKISEYEGAVKGLNMDLAGAEARLSDLKGELSESQKNEIDNLKLEVQKLEEESLALRVQLSKLSGIIDALNQDLDNKKIENNNILQTLSETKSIVLEKEARIQDLEFQMKQEKDSLVQSLNQIEQEGRIVNELASFGSQCRGERHHQIIESQKLALSEMRQKMKVLEATKIPKELGGLFRKFDLSYDSTESLDTLARSGPKEKINRKEIMEMVEGDVDNLFPKILKNTNVPEITQQMLEMKRELAALRSKKALRDGAPHGMKSLIDVIALKEKARGQVLAITNGEKKPDQKKEGKLDYLDQEKLIKQLEFDLDVEKSRLIDSQQNLDFSELSYLNLLRETSLALEIENIKGLQTFRDLNADDRDALRLDREESCGLIVQKIRILKERIQRKEELLQGYEQDLVKLKQAEDLAIKTQSQLDNIFQQMRFKGEEVELLRETLNRTKDLLNEEKRTNTAIKKHKHYIPEKTPTDGKPVSTSPKLHCPTNESLIKEQIVEKHKLEKNKRKDYEIKCLKAELYRKEKELSHANNRLYTLETSMGIKSEEPVS